VKTKLVGLSLLVCCVTSLSLTVVSCGTLKKEFLSPSENAPPATLATNTLFSPPAIVAQLQQGSQIAGEVLPSPWGGLVSSALLLLSSGAAAFATFHARKASVASATALANANSVQPAALPPKVT
jgi:hypothetical protein